MQATLELVRALRDMGARTVRVFRRGDGEPSVEVEFGPGEPLPTVTQERTKDEPPPIGEFATEYARAALASSE